MTKAQRWCNNQDHKQAFKLTQSAALIYSYNKVDGRRLPDCLTWIWYLMPRAMWSEKKERRVFELSWVNHDATLLTWKTLRSETELKNETNVSVSWKLIVKMSDADILAFPRSNSRMEKWQKILYRCWLVQLINQVSPWVESHWGVKNWELEVPPQNNRQ